MRTTNFHGIHRKSVPSRYSEPSDLGGRGEIPNDGLFRHGRLLVVYPSRHFPDRCVKSNEPTTKRIRRVLYWHVPAIYLLVIASPIVYVIAALFFRRKAEFQLPLSERFLMRRRANLWVAVLLLLGGVVAFIVGNAIHFTPQAPSDLFLVASALTLLGPVLWVSASIWGILGCRVVWPRYIDDRLAMISGAGAEFLATLPEWPDSRPAGGTILTKSLR